MIAVLGINISHCSSACMLIDGKLVAAVAEERMNRIKSSAVFPQKSVLEVLRISGIKCGEVDAIAIGTICEQFEPVKAQDKEYRSMIKVVSFISRLIPLEILGSELLRWFYIKSVGTVNKIQILKECREFFKELNLPVHRIKFFEHHYCHAAVAYYMRSFRDNALVFTNDGLGDGLSATVSIGQGYNLTRVDSISSVHSIGSIYSRVTKFLGLKPWEDESKVMGLAPYARGDDKVEVYEKLKKIIKIKDGKYKNRIGVIGSSFLSYLFKEFQGVRFDHMAYAAQCLLEETLINWMEENIKKYKIRKIALSGGVFLNVKAIKRITENPLVDDIFIFPAAGDESIAIGASILYYLECIEEKNRKLKEEEISEKFRKNHEDFIEPLKNLYLGPDVSDSLSSILKIFDHNKYKIIEPADINNEAAELLANGEIVARCTGRLEFGPRALGNRSILASPSNLENVQKINSLVKNRDFWMPFSPTILDKWAKNYLVNPKNISSHYMINSFEIKKEYEKHLLAAMHPQDKTVRPQVLEKNWNPEYYSLIEKFESKTGIGALLNTSLNMHGSPIAGSSIDAMEVFEKSGLKYIILDKYMIVKKE